MPRAGEVGAEGGAADVVIIIERCG